MAEHRPDQAARVLRRLADEIECLASWLKAAN